MAEHPAVQPDRRHGVGSILLWAAGLPMVYVLSFGPVARYVGDRTFVTAFYKPLIVLHETSPVAKRLLEWYVEDIWGVK